MCCRRHGIHGRRRCRDCGSCRACGAHCFGITRLEVGIALAFVPPAVAQVGTTVDIDVRGSLLAAEVVPTPFVQRS
ncbi:MAG: hypothetical protein EB104_02435 [Acidimicrobiia bacterium]|nr:hypothetical protein [Acidimicrobiia bacterium]